MIPNDLFARHGPSKSEIPSSPVCADPWLFPADPTNLPRLSLEERTDTFHEEVLQGLEYERDKQASPRRRCRLVCKSHQGSIVCVAWGKSIRKRFALNRSMQCTRQKIHWPEKPWGCARHVSRIDLGVREPTNETKVRHYVQACSASAPLRHNLPSHLKSMQTLDLTTCGDMVYPVG